MKTRIMKYLADGVKPVDISTIVGCTPAYVSQLLKDEDFKAELEEYMQTHSSAPDAEDTRLTTRYVNIEHKLLSAMEGAMADAKLGEITRALEVVAKRQIDVKTLNKPVVPTTQVTMVSLTLPASSKIAAPKVIMNEAQEVIAIGNNVLAPMSSEGVKSMFQQIKERTQNAIAAAQTGPIAIPADF